MSALHAAACCCRFSKQVTDRTVYERLSTPAESLGTCLQDIDANRVDVLWDLLLSHAAQLESNSALAKQVLEDHAGIVASERGQSVWFVEQTEVDPITQRRLTGCITDVEAAFKLMFPKLLEQLEFRIRPLQEQWVGYGGGFIKQVSKTTDPDALLSELQVFGVQPIIGGAGGSHHQPPSVHIEAVLTNPLMELPEVCRLAWLSTQVYSTGYRSKLGIKPEVLRRLLPLAMLMPVLSTAQLLELCRYDRNNDAFQDLIALAIEHWHIAIPRHMDLANELVPLLVDWWTQSIASAKSAGSDGGWSRSLEELAHRLGLNPV